MIFTPAMRLAIKREKARRMVTPTHSPTPEPASGQKQLHIVRSTRPVHSGTRRQLVR